MMARIKDKTKSTDVELLTAILDVLTPAQVLILADKLRQVMGRGYGRVTVVIHDGSPCQIQLQESYNFRDPEIIDSS
jgi:hypothetical protein